MDDYPAHLEPHNMDSPTGKEPFDEWWERVRDEFPTVPANVGEQLLHRHWGQSPYEWIPSRAYRFSLERWPSERLKSLKSRFCDWNYEKDIEHGRYLVEEMRYPVWLTDKVVETRNFPEPIIVLDNRDGHLVSGEAPVPPYEDMPTSYVLIEGHLRFSLAAFLMSQNKFADEVEIWMMRPV